MEQRRRRGPPPPSSSPFHPHVFVFPDEQRSSVNESSSLLGGSPHRHCRRKSSPYHTGQLHPAVRVADLLQHINQMKTAEGYGFKQEYEVRDSLSEPLSFEVGPGHASNSDQLRNVGLQGRRSPTRAAIVGVPALREPRSRFIPVPKDPFGVPFFTCGLWRATPTRLF